MMRLANISLPSRVGGPELTKGIGQVERAATYLESHEPRELFDSIQESARRQPALVIGAGIAIGLVLGRLLRTTMPIDDPAGRPYRAGGTPATPISSVSPSCTVTCLLTSESASLNDSL
jgi:hypothetical protein